MQGSGVLRKKLGSTSAKVKPVINGRSQFELNSSLCQPLCVYFFCSELRYAVP